MRPPLTSHIRSWLPWITSAGTSTDRSPAVRYPDARTATAWRTRPIGWLSPPYDLVVAMQSVHEVRHKRHVPTLYARIFGLLAAGGRLLVCDHSPDGLTSRRATELHSTEEEQHRAMASAGFVDVGTNLERNGLYLCSARRPT